MLYQLSDGRPIAAVLHGNRNHSKKLPAMLPCHYSPVALTRSQPIESSIYRTTLGIRTLLNVPSIQTDYFTSSWFTVSATEIWDALFKTWSTNNVISSSTAQFQTLSTRLRQLGKIATSRMKRRNHSRKPSHLKRSLSPPPHKRNATVSLSLFPFLHAMRTDPKRS